MPPSVPSVLAPYLQTCLQARSTTLITSVLDTPANWLVLRFIRAALFGTDDEVGTSDISLGNNTSCEKPACVVLMSFLRSLNFWTELGKKSGVDIPTLTTKKQLSYVDALTIGLGTPPLSSKTIKTNSHSLEDISHAIAAAKSALPTESTHNLVIDGLDFVLATQPDITASELTTFITRAREQFNNVVLTISADAPLLHNAEASATPLEAEHGVFVRSLAHQCGWIYQLRPLETGFAKDVSGVVRVSKGGNEDGDIEGGLSDGEWLYQVKGDGSVRVWSRGE